MQFDQIVIQTPILKRNISNTIIDKFAHQQGASLQKVKQIFENEDVRHLGNSKIVYKYACQVIGDIQDLEVQISSLSTNYFVGSIAYVFKAILKDNQEIAIKIVREDKDAILKEQLSNHSSLLNSSLSFLPTKKFKHINIFSNDFLTGIEEEYDFKNEIINYKNFTKILKSYNHLSFPDYFDNYSSKKALVFSWIDSDKNLNSIESTENKSQILNDLTHLFFFQTFETGEYQEDSNLGNFIFHKNKIHIIDFGKISFIPVKDRISILTLLFARREHANIDYVSILVDLGFNAELLLPVRDKVPDILDIMFDPWLSKTDYDFANWKPSQKINMLLGNDKWNFRSASPYSYFKITRSIVGFLKIAKKINSKASNLKEITRMLFDSYRDIIHLDKLILSTSPKKADILNIIIRKDDKEKINLKLPFHIIYNIEEYINDETLSTIESLGIDIHEVVSKALQEGKDEIFSFEDKGTFFIVKRT